MFNVCAGDRPDIASATAAFGRGVGGEDGSLRITAVVGDSPAEKAGVRVDDTLVSVNGVTLSKDTAESAMMKDDDWKIGGVLTLGLKRGAETSTIKVRFEKIPETLLARIIETHAKEYHPIAKN